MKILAVGGGSGGHVTPVAAVLSSLAAQTSIDQVMFVCDKGFSTQAKAVMAHLDIGVPIEVKIITAGKFRRYRHFGFKDYLLHPSVMAHNLLDAGRLIWGTVQSVSLLLRHRPDIIFAKGGFVCLPVGFAAWLLRIPIVIHDSDARPGLTNRVLSRFARQIATGYPVENYSYPSAITAYTGVPIADQFHKIDTARQHALKRSLHLDESTPLIVAVGGGLGARSINEAMVEALPKLAEAEAFAYIIAGKKNIDETKSMTQSYHNVKAVGFLSEGLPLLLMAADIVVTRASATSLQELAGLAKPTIAVPAKALSDQHKNAQVYRDAHAAIVLDDDEIAMPGRLGREIVRLLGDDAERQRLGMAIHDFAKPNAAADVARLIVETHDKCRQS